MVCTISWGVGCQVLDWEVQLAAVALLQGELPRRDHCGGVPREGVPAGAADKETHARERALCAKRAALWEWWHWSVSSLQGPKLTGELCRM